MAGHHLEILISGQRLEAQKASVFATPRGTRAAGEQLIIGQGGCADVGYDVMVKLSEPYAGALQQSRS
jgi:hypothetical protein